MSALIDEAHEFLCIMDKQEYADEVYRLRARVAELEAQISTGDYDYTVDEICNAYESGVGHRGRPTAHVNPYKPGSDLATAYAIGAVGDREAQVAAPAASRALEMLTSAALRDANRYRVIRGHLGHVAWKDSDNALIGVGVAKTPGEPYRGNRVADFDAAADALLAASGRQDGAR